MDYYKPFLSDLFFVYDHIESTLNIKSTVRVLLPAEESLTLTNSYNDVTKTVEKLFDHASNPSQLLPYEFIEDSSVEIMNHIEIHYDEHDQEGFKSKLRDIMADEYTVKAIVKDKPGQSGSGGNDEKIIAKASDIQIV